MVEAALVLALVADGVPAAAALPAVLLYRLISLVGVVAAGWTVFAAQQFQRNPAAVADAARSGHDARDQRSATSPEGHQCGTVAHCARLSRFGSCWV